MKRVLIFGFTTALSLAYAPSAHAITIGTTTFNGDVFTVSYVTTADLGIDGPADNDAKLVTVTVDTSGHTNPSTGYFIAVAPNLGSPEEYSTLVSYTAPGTWAYVNGGTNSGGCDGHGNPFFCASYTGGTKAFDDGSTYSWTWYVDFDSTDFSGAALKAVWNAPFAQMSNELTLGTGTGTGTGTGPGTGKSDGETPVPEPASLLLLGSGLAFVSNRVRNRNKKRK